MAQAKLPLRIKVDIRDQFESSDSSVQKAFETLGGTVGLKVQCIVEWELLYQVLEPMFEDKATFIPSIAEVIVSWCDVLSTRLEDDDFSAWTDELVTKVSQVGLVKLRLQTANRTRPTTEWSDGLQGFLISFPQKTKFASINASSVFESDFACLFAGSEAPSSSVTLPIRNREDDWAEINEDAESSIASMGPAHQSQPAKSIKLPAVNTLPTLDLFLKSTAPYILLVTQKGSGRFTETGSSNVFHAGSGRAMGQGSSTLTEHGAGNLIIQGTHEPSLHFLEQYLQRWIKKDHQDTRKVPLLKIKLHESNFGIGVNHDTLTIEPYDTYQERRGVVMNPAVVLLLIENILGYHCVSRFHFGHWEYRRDTPFE